MHRALKPSAQQVAHHLVADLAGVTAGADHRHRPRREQAAHRLGRRRPRARSSIAASASGVGLIPRRTSTMPSAKRVADSKPAWVNTPIILPVRRQHGGREPGEADLPGPHREVLQQHRGQPAPVVGVVDEEGHLGLGAVAPPVVAGHAEQLVAPHGHERHAVDVVDVGHPLDVALAQAGPGAEVPEVDALRATGGRGSRGCAARRRGGSVARGPWRRRPGRRRSRTRRDSPPAPRRVRRHRPAPCGEPTSGARPIRRGGRATVAVSPTLREDPAVRRPTLLLLAFVALMAVLAGACSSDSDEDPLSRRGRLGLRRERRPRGRPRRAHRTGHRPRGRRFPDLRRHRAGGPHRRRRLLAARVRGPLRRGVPDREGRLLAVRPRLRAAPVRDARAQLRRHRRERLLLPGRRPHRLGQREPRARHVREVRRLHPRHRLRPRVRPRRPDPGGVAGRHDHDGAPGGLLRRRVDGRRRRRELQLLRAAARRPRQGHRRVPRAPRWHGHRRRRPVGPRHRLRSHRRVRRGLRARPRALPRLPGPLRRRRARDRRGALHRPGGLRARRQPAARRDRGPRVRRPAAVLGRGLRRAGPEWDPVDLVSPIVPDTDEVTCGEDTYSGDVLVNASFYCVPSDTIYLDAINLVPALYEIGDYAVATELARQFAYAAEVRLGNLDNTSPRTCRPTATPACTRTAGSRSTAASSSCCISPPATSTRR